MKKIILIALCQVFFVPFLWCVSYITLVTNDNQEFTYVKEKEISLFSQCKTISNFLQDFKDQKEAALYWYLPMIDAESWKTIINCLELMAQHGGSNDHEGTKNIETIFSKLPTEALYKLINALNYLNNFELLNRALDQWIALHALGIFEADDEKYTFCKYIEELIEKKIAHQLGLLFAQDKDKPLKARILHQYTCLMRSVCYSPHGDFIITCSVDGFVHIWDARTGRLMRRLDYPGIISMCCSPDGKFLAGGSAIKIIRVRNIEAGNVVFDLIHPGWPRAICYSPNGKFLASGSTDAKIRIWKTDTGDIVNTLLGHSADVLSICYSPDGNFIASGSKDTTIRIWDSHKAELIKLLLGHSNRVTAVHYSPDGNFIASCSDDRTIRIWNVSTGAVSKKLCVDTSNWNKTISYSPDGNLIISGGSYGIHIWNAETGSLVHRVVRHNGWPNAVCFSPDGNFFASCAYDNTLRIWDFMHSIHQLVEHSTPKQQLFLLLAFLRKKQNKELVLDKTHLKTIFDSYAEERQILIKRILPITRAGIFHELKDRLGFFSS